MSLFDAYTTTQEVEIKRKFLNEPKKDFLRKAGLVPAEVRRCGRHARYDPEALRNLDARVNVKAHQAEAASTFAERLEHARDYRLLTDAALSRLMGVSRELVRLWRTGRVYPSDTARLAEILGVPHTWLIAGGEEKLPANSEIGVRVGEEAMRIRALLREKTLGFLEGLPPDTPVSAIQAYIEEVVQTNPHIAQLARRAGGRWQYHLDVRSKPHLVFAPWAPLPEHGLSKRLWSDEVEGLIAQKMASGKSIYRLAKELQSECAERGWRCPTKIALYKRMQVNRMRTVRFGVNLNAVMAQARHASH